MESSLIKKLSVQDSLWLKIFYTNIVCLIPTCYVFMEIKLIPWCVKFMKGCVVITLEVVRWLQRSRGRVFIGLLWLLIVSTMRWDVKSVSACSYNLSTNRVLLVCVSSLAIYEMVNGCHRTFASFNSGHEIFVSPNWLFFEVDWRCCMFRSKWSWNGNQLCKQFSKRIFNSMGLFERTRESELPFSISSEDFSTNYKT